jgi:hypothetical protein
VIQDAQFRRLLTKASVETWSRRLNRPAGRAATLLLGLLILAAPYWLFSDLLQGFALRPTDFVYIQESRDVPALRQHLMTPLNTHVVPLFRLWTYALVRTAVVLGELPRVLFVACYLSLVLTMVLVGSLVLAETSRAGLALAAMALLGTSTVVLPALDHYAAGQALWAAAAVVASLIAGNAWRAKGGGWRLALVAIGVISAPAIWSGGLTAGPTVAAALWADSRPQCRRAALALIVITSLCVAAILWLSRPYVQHTPMVWERHEELWPRPVQGVLHSSQAIVEALLLNNLGLDAETAPVQAVVIVACVAGLWYGTRGRHSRATPLEAAGAVLVIASALSVYFFRGNLPFSSVRKVAWYHLMPQVGAVLFAAGWWAGIRQNRTIGGYRLTWGGILAVLAVVLAFFEVQAVRAERILNETTSAFTPARFVTFTVPEMKRMWALYLNKDFADRQRRMLARLDQVEQIARRRGIGKAAIRRTFGLVYVTGMPAKPAPYDAAGILSLPEGDPNLSPDLVRSALADYYRQEPEPHPFQPGGG